MRSHVWIVRSLSPSIAEAWSNKSVALGNLGRHKDALACCGKALELNPCHPEGWYNKAGILGELGRFEEAIECCDRALAYRPNYAAAWFNKGVALYKLERDGEARKSFKEAARLGDPHASQALANLDGH